MEANEYQKKCLRSAGKNARTLNEQEGALDMCALGIAGEGGEFADHIKKWLYHGHPLDKEYLKKELGDIQWYVARAAAALDVPLSELMADNVRKLETRYPQGFSEERSLNRVA